jgi:hypothetical protein
VEQVYVKPSAEPRPQDQQKLPPSPEAEEFAAALRGCRSHYWTAPESKDTRPHLVCECGAKRPTNCFAEHMDYWMKNPNAWKEALKR